MCRLEKEVTFLEEVKRDLDNRIAAFNQAIESNNATITDLRLQLDNTSMEKVGSECAIWTSCLILLTDRVCSKTCSTEHGQQSGFRLQHSG